ncbi:MAG TPA: ribulose-phosphate 3-epimerase [Nitrospiria bacterium]|nr:ribulose-phosphate 3-epimerase [Nitrospiria bacterium]
MKKIAPSILSADFLRLGEEISRVEEAGADLIHIDVMDGHFVPNLTIGPPVIEAIRKITRLPLDVHLMINNPDQMIPDFIKAGADYLTVHAEALIHMHRTVQLIREKGIRCGIALNPATSLSAIENIIGDIDLLLLMSVNPGFGGQTFIPFMLEKVTAAKMMINERGCDVELEIDGGVKIENIDKIARTGVDIFVAGTAIFGCKDYKWAIDEMRRRIEEIQV